MTDYSRISKAELIARIKELESRGSASTARETSGAQSNTAPAALADSEARLRAILETAVEGIITIEERGLIESFNPAAEKTFGYRAEEVIGKNVSLLMPPPFREEHNDYLANYLRTGKARIIGIGREVVARRKDGTTFPIDLSVSEVRLANRRLFTGFVRNISERKRLEKDILEISDREQRRIGQDLHDGLCQQLAGIELMSEVLEQKLAAKSRSDAARVGEIAGHVRDVISQTRLLARGLSPVTLDSEGLMSALQELASNSAKLFMVDCRFECDPPVLVDDQPVATHLFRIAQEAVSNALKHGKASQIAIQLKEQRGRAVLTVSDNGKGFPEIIPGRKGMGLRIMQSRSGMIGGTLTIGNQTGGGAQVVCSVALKPRLKQNGRARGRQKEKSKS